MCRCCSNNCICDPCALCWGEYKGDITIAEDEADGRLAGRQQQGGAVAPTEEEMERE